MRTSAAGFCCGCRSKRSRSYAPANRCLLLQEQHKLRLSAALDLFSSAVPLKVFFFCQLSAESLSLELFFLRRCGKMLASGWPHHPPLFSSLHLFFPGTIYIYSIKLLKVVWGCFCLLTEKNAVTPLRLTGAGCRVQHTKQVSCRFCRLWSNMWMRKNSVWEEWNLCPALWLIHVPLLLYFFCQPSIYSPIYPRIKWP